MKLKFLALILVVLGSVQSQAQTHMRVHQKDKTIFGLPIAEIDSVKLTSTLQLVHLKGNPGFVDTTALSNIDSVTHAEPVTNNLYDVISSDANLSQLKSGIEIGELNPYPFGLSGNMTVFAPVNSGLTSYGINLLNLTPAQNNYYIAYHTIQGKYNLADFPTAKNTKYYTMNVPADSVFVTKVLSGTSTFTFVNGVQVSTTLNNIPASNGVIHKLSSSFGVLFPPIRNIYDEINKTTYSANAFRYDSIAKLVARAAQADPTIINTLKDNVLTFMAPSNSAITSFLTGFGGSINNVPAATALSLVKDHMILGRNFFIDFQVAAGTGLPSYNGSNLKLANIGSSTAPDFVFYYIASAGVRLFDFDYMQTNGVIHQINGVLTK